MATINLSLSSKVDSITRKVPILFRFVGGRGSIYRVKSGFYLNPDRWSNKESKIIIPRLATPEQKELVKLQKQLDELCNVILETFANTDKSTISKQWLETEIDRYHYPEKYEVKEPEHIYTFFEQFDEFLDKRKLSEVRKKNFRVIGRALQRYELYKSKTTRKTFTLTLDSFTTDTLRELEKFFKQEHIICSKYPEIYKAISESRTPQPRGQNTINDIFTKLRTFFLWTIDGGKTSNNPFKGFAVEECTYGTPYYINIEERNQLYNTDLTHRPQLAIQRDIFVFQCLVGCRVSDLYRLTKSNVINGAIEYIARKTKEGRPVTVRVPLNAIAKEILERYSDVENVRLFPFMSEQKYNVAIKDAFLLAGLTRSVTILNPTTGEPDTKPLNEIASSHLARRCFVGNLYRQVKDPNLVGALSGHKEGSRAFARYREIDENMKNELVKLLE